MRILLLVLLSMLIHRHASAQPELAQVPTSPDAEKLFKEGEKAYQRGEHAQAITYFDQVIALDGEHLNAYLQRGFCHTLLKDYSKAVKDFTAVIARKPDHQWAYTSRGGAYNKLGEHAQAIQDFDMAISLDAKNTEAYNNRGWARKATGDMTGACKDWKASQRLGNGEAKIILSNNRCK